MKLAQNLRKLALIEFIMSAVSFVINYFFFHFVTDEGITTVWQPEPGKPFITDLIGLLATLFLFAAITCFIASYVFNDKNEK